MRWIAILCLLALPACIDPEFEPATRVSRPRVLAVIADRPELHPGDGARVHAVLAGVDALSVELRWSMCLGSGPLETGGFGGGGAFGASGAEQFGGGVADPGCDVRSEYTTPLAIEAGEALVPGDCADPAEPWRCTSGIAELFAAAGGASGAPPELVTAILDTVGVAITVHVDLYVDGELRESAFKRIGITRRDSVGTNPPAPRFAVGDVWMSARGGADPHVCAPELGARPVVSGLSEVRLRPDPADGDWLERFPVIAIDGSVIEGTENAYYSWFSAGEFDPEISVAPVRDTVWLTPEEVGVYPLWVVVRDGHLGASACRVEIEVVEVVPPYTGIERL